MLPTKTTVYITCSVRGTWIPATEKEENERLHDQRFNCGISIRCSSCMEAIHLILYMLRMSRAFLAAESLLGRLPVDHIPDGTEVFGLAVLVLEIVLCIVSINA